MVEIYRVLIPLDSQDSQTFGLMLSYVEQIAKNAGVSNVILLTHTKAQFDSTSLSRFLGAAVSKALSKGKKVNLPWGGTIKGETMKTLVYPARDTIVVAYYADESLLDFVDNLHGVRGVVAVPWVRGEADGWAARWNARIHGREVQPPSVLIEDPVVVRALEILTGIINLSTGLGHPSDRKMADEMLRILRAKGHRDPSGQIKSWAIRHKWSPSAASDLEALAKKVWSLRTKPSLAAFHDPDGRYNRWKADG